MSKVFPFHEYFSPFNHSDVCDAGEKTSPKLRMGIFPENGQTLDGMKNDDNNYEIHGNYKINGNKMIITELPVGEWTSNYKEFLEKDDFVNIEFDVLGKYVQRMMDLKSID